MATPVDPEFPPVPLPSNVDIMISLARIDERVRGMSDAKRNDHVIMERETARIDLESRQRDTAIAVRLDRLDEAVATLKLSWAKAAGMAAIVAAVVASALSAVIANVMR